MTWVNPKDTEIIIKNCVNSIIDDLDFYDYEADKGNNQYKKELFVFFKKIFNKYGLLKTEYITTIDDFTTYLYQHIFINKCTNE